ncbi:MAG: hypothetical protein A3E27_04430 [Deltaproteobacteria bacterium RIFCSPHIGHO2_12_FULL_40_32]|nr:MAG: hypothetical protein A3E27_04430 [Deltaproteobacteria bacterium RIFCSPHIGHO2_12_FULL_40_32]
MIEFQKINWKLHFKNPEAAQADDFFKVFNTWIPDSPEIFIDVADYQHVRDGTITILVGHYVDYALDEMDRKLGFLYSHKRLMDGSNQDKLQNTFRDFLNHAQKLLDDSFFKGKLNFDTAELLFFINDRALAPNTPQTLEAAKPDLIQFADKIFGKGNYTIKPQANSTKRFGVLFQNSKPISISELIKKI